MNELRKIRVLLAEDSRSQREAISWVIGNAPYLELVGEAANGAEAVDMVEQLQPDIVLMDCHMPVMDGIEATRVIMGRCPVPIVVTSATFDVNDVHPGLEALHEGALAIVPKPLDPAAENFDRLAEELCLTLKLMADVKVVRRLPPRRSAANPRPPRETAERPADRPAPVREAREIRIVAVGASTGGPPVVLDILRRLGPRLDVPMLLVQHMSPGFIVGFASWLTRGSGLPVEVAAANVVAAPGRVYVAPEGHHLGIDRRGRLTLDDGPPENGFRPSVSCLFRSVADAFGREALAILLTGMGQDGAEGLAYVGQKGGVTAAQDKDSSVVFGMPAAAIRMGAAQRVLAPPDIAKFVVAQLARRRHLS
ncbi:response regulator receiver modulated CheB methylesterase [Ancylobacter novellus DSM 506]|uniref:Protein-glutamate methylesterase/protein-glutamine glutaminase n=1 Tax=Ancylobacter novellus (strain ATCC 8093 / DSM 506 / JCM 20403 / CCM 1077 / IAM 12100 / NBRC 12443 / NCIMB 10456) TaxID=639283 RepID=D7A029_ANCN5|nr:chemotaxis-specific protein-glutamate methyltransferase CheB [Ancylobacter novellus]ADH89290.1 response regulator receiver modulated CheB methylesterase [Ancylobacter novellus DSM 506]